MVSQLLCIINSLFCCIFVRSEDRLVNVYFTILKLMINYTSVRYFFGDIKSHRSGGDTMPYYTAENGQVSTSLLSSCNNLLQQPDIRMRLHAFTKHVQLYTHYFQQVLVQRSRAYGKSMSYLWRIAKSQCHLLSDVI